MKKILPLLFISASLFGYAQNFIVTNNQGTPYTNGETIAAEITSADLYYGEYVIALALNNITSAPVSMNTLRTNIELPDSIRAYVCCFENCYDDDVFAMSGTVEAGKHDEYTLHIYPRGGYGLCKFKLEFWTEENQMDLFMLFVEIDYLELAVNDNNNTPVSLWAYPNPASPNSTITISYTLSEKNMGQQLSIKNILGATVMNIPLNAFENTVSIDASSLKSGIYFYGIENNNHLSLVKKLIIK